MSIDLCILASGSSGNCTVVRTPAGALLIDAGIGPRVARQRLCGSGICLNEIKAICLTHLDRDHFNFNWTRTLIQSGIRIYCAANRLDELRSLLGDEESHALAPLIRPFNSRPFQPLPGLSAHPLRLAHDEAGSWGFLLHGFGCRIGYATDLGRVPAQLIQHFEAVDVLAIESNYDSQMQRDSGRPLFLRKRIMGGRGHLSNEQAFDAVCQILDRSQKRGRLPSHVVLLHRSRQCNCPDLLRQFFSRDHRIAPRLILAEQFHRTDWLRPRPSQPLIGEQLSLAWINP